MICVKVAFAQYSSLQISDTLTYAFFIVLTYCLSFCMITALKAQQMGFLLCDETDEIYSNRLLYQQSVVDKNHFNEGN